MSMSIRLDWLVLPFWAFCLSRMLIFFVGYVGDVYFPTDPGHWVAAPDRAFLSMWSKWDSQWYVQIAREGYFFRPMQQSNVAFFPLYPLSMRVLSRLTTGNLVLAGILISNVAFLWALVFLYRLAALELGDRESARRTVFYLAFFPTAFFFSALYTESTFLLFAVATIYFARRRFWLLAAIAGVLASMTRNLGVLLWALVTWEWLRCHGWRITQAHHGQAWCNLRIGLREHWHEIVVLATIPLGLFLYMAFLKMNFDRPFAFLEAQAGWGRSNVGPVAVLLRDLVALVEFESNRSYINRFLNVATVFAILGTVPFIWRKLGEGYAIYVLILVLVPISSATMSMTRYALTIFPFFIMLGWWGRHPTIDRTLLATFAILLGLLTTIFVNWIFVA